MYQWRIVSTYLIFSFVLVAGVLVLTGTGLAVTLDRSGSELPVLDETENVTTETLTTGTEAGAHLHEWTGETSSQPTSPQVELTKELRLVPDEPGIYEVEHTYTTPEEMRSLEFTLPESAEVQEVTGFHQRDDRTYEWDAATAQPTATYRLEANRTIDQDGPIAGPGRYIFVDVGDWAVVTKPSVSHRWGWSGPERVGFHAEMTTRQGVASDVIAYLGEYESYTESAHDQQFELVVPEAASLTEDKTEIFESIGDASGTLRVGERDEEVFMLAVPTETVDWGVRGLQTGPADLWVRDVERVDTGDNVWIHEYVHTRQGYAAASDARWFTEATATYYAALLSLEQDRISFDAFRERLDVGTQHRYRHSILAQPATWARGADYNVGALVSGELDRQIRLTSDGQVSFQEVFRQLNEQDGVVSATEYNAILEETANRDVAELGETYTQSTTHPSMWDRHQHAEAFEGVTPARITYALADEQSTHVSGPYRDRVLGPERPHVFVPGETLRVDVLVENFGGATGQYDANLRVDDEVQSTQTGTLESGESRTLSFEHTFDAVGEQTVSVGDVELPVSVREPAPVTVTAFEAEETALAVGETVTLSATVTNDASYPGEGSIILSKDGEHVDQHDSKLDAESTETVEFEYTFTEAGTYVFDLGELTSATVVVTVTDEPTDEDEHAEEELPEEDDEPADVDDDGSGFGVVLGAFTLMLGAFTLMLGARYRQQRYCFDSR